MATARASTSQPRALHLLGFSFLFAHCVLITAWATPMQFTLHDVSGFWCGPLAGCLKKLPPQCSAAALPAELWANCVPVCSSFPEQLNPSEISGQIIQSDLQCTSYFCGCSCADLASACVSHVHDTAGSKSTVPDLCLGCACPTVGQIQLAAIMFPSQGPVSKKPYVFLFIISYVIL